MKTNRYVNDSKGSYWRLVFGLCLFIWLLSFKPSEPYLSQFLICNQSTELATCNEIELQSECTKPCLWSSSNSISSCSTVTSCGNITSAAACSSIPYSNYCFWQSTSASCQTSVCYKQFTEDQVNNDIYPWSTYAYLPFLCLLGPFAEVYSYRIAILFGISGRVATRFLLIYGQSLLSQQLMQVVYSMGTAAEDVFSAYIYYVVPHKFYTDVTAYVKASALLACVLSGILGDILVTQADVSLDVLMAISAAFVCTGFVVGLFVIKKSNKSNKPIMQQEEKALNTTIDSSSVTRGVTRNPWVLFKQQMRCLHHTMRNNIDLSSLLVYWVFGNAVFTIVYNYEVSIYVELNGNNNWNGSVLSIMLLAGSFGAMLPSLLQTGVMSSSLRSCYITIAEVVSVISLVLAIVTWEIISTVALLTIFFASWQFINVITFAQLAIGLRQSQDQLINNDNSPASSKMESNVSNEPENISFMHGKLVESSSTKPLDHERSLPSPSSDESAAEPSSESVLDTDLEPPYSVAVVSVIAICVLLQIILQAVLFSGLQLDLRDAMWVVVWLHVACTILHVIFMCVMRLLLNGQGGLSLLEESQDQGLENNSASNTI